MAIRESDSGSDPSRRREEAILPELLELTSMAAEGASGLAREAASAMRREFAAAGVPPERALDERQSAAHSLAWFATYGECLRQMHQWASGLDANEKFGEVEQLILQIAFGEYVNQIRGGIAMSQGEIARLEEVSDSLDGREFIESRAARLLSARGNSQNARMRLAKLMAERRGSSSFGDLGLDQELEIIRSQIRRFADDKVFPNAQEWHMEDRLIPMELISELAEMGVFGLTIPEEYDGLAMSKTAMCVVSEELSRGYIGVGSLATRTEIAAELILCGGTDWQKREWLPRIASGEIMPTAVFTEPNTGSDLGSLRTKAALDNGMYSVTGSKTWITHGSRANVMTLLARTDPESSDYRGLSMFIVEKTPGTEEYPFPDDGIDGTEIEVLGYRGMKEYEIGFSGFRLKADCLLGCVEGRGFRQLMQTFESARIQTAARAIGVAQSALDQGLEYALNRKQFGKPLIEFPRVASKLAIMAVEIMVARQLAYFAAREKDSQRRCDLEAGMAKLLAARVAWSAADNAVQIHGGNGFAVEFPISRILCDSRILSIFEGAAEIQAHVIARRLLGNR
ncbi:MAG: acyl-CoA/acyl-ACP dehydrogenase [Albidovulum sp.]|nr:acyl-CoA/acyl-ACP dehydrogenase [Albidovulum sp.]